MPKVKHEAKQQKIQIMIGLLKKIYIYIYTTFIPHFKGKRRCISGIIALLAVLRNAVTRIGGSIYKLYPS